MKPVITQPKSDSWLKLTLATQGLLLLYSCVMFCYRFMWLPQFPEAGMLGADAIEFSVGLIPNLMLFALLILGARCAASLGLVLAAVGVLIAATLTDHLLFLNGPGTLLWGFSLVSLAIANFYSLDDARATLAVITLPFQYTIVKVLLTLAGMYAGLVGMSFLFFGVIFSDLGDQNLGGYAPEAGYAARRAWGQKEMPRYFQHVDEWVRRSDLITADLGKVTKVAPIGWPNNYITFFTDGPNVVMNLQVVGERGEGILNLPHVYLTSYPVNKFEIAATSTWNFSGNSTSIVSSGKSWIKEKGFGEQHSQIISAASQGKYDRVLQACHSLEQSLPKQFDENDRRRWGRKLHCGMFLGLPPSDRRALLLLLGDSHATAGNADDALGCYFDAAGISFNAIEESPWNHHCSSTKVDPAVVTREIENANEALRKAHKIVPEDETLKELGRERSLLAYRHRNGHLLDSTWNLSDEQLRARSVAELRDLYNIPIILARQSPWLRKELGRMRFRCKKHSGNHIFINERDRYQARVTLEIAGSTGVSGSFEMKVFETPELSSSIDLYAPVPRFPLQNYRGNSLTWRPEGGKRVRLDSKTLMPRKKSPKKKKILALWN